MTANRAAGACPIMVGLALVVALSSCGSRTHPATDSAVAGSTDALAPGSELATKVRAREQDILAALPLARRVPRIIRSSDGRHVFEFEGYFSGRELVCVKALPPPQGDTTSVDQYFFERGRLLSFEHEMRSRGGTDGVPELAVHALFSPGGATLDFEMRVNGEPHPLPPPEREALLRMTRRMAKEAYDEVQNHPNG